MKAQRRTYQDLSNLKSTKQKNKLISMKATKKEMQLLHDPSIINKDMKQSSSIQDLKAPLKAKQSNFEKRTQASSTSGQNSLHGSPVIKAIEIDADQSLDPIFEMPSSSVKKASTALLGSTKKYRSNFCMSSFKAAPKASELPGLPF
eukprot:CAMPEP_0197016808 /NCGR_PEP_ID=MMETSP1380-20130617/79176_1 /TAXON_ID=5936 /ORGANISM="Euplotes crassus, Strain CT5" /LENGTH=146 /DNA_ID=CAMNT_0042443807 /DNA_START=547 /DNA_END=987 /DNA_ORIENTATION=-